MSLPRRIVALSAMLCMLPLAGCTTYLARAEINYQTTLDLAGVTRVYVETGTGKIDVQCDPARKDADIQAVKFASGTTEEDARLYAEEVQIHAERDPQRADTVRIVAQWPPNAMGRSRGAAFTIALPPHPALELKTTNGPVSVARAASGANIDTSNGAVTVLDTKGEIMARTRNGRVTLRGVDGDIDAQSSNGRIELDRVGRSSVKVVTSNGAIHAVNVKGNVSARTSNGSIDLRLVEMPARPEISAVSSNGRVLVETPATVNARLNMRTSNGRVHAELAEVGTMRDFESGRSHLSATLNQGEGQIEIRSSNGAVTFRTATTPVATAR